MYTSYYHLECKPFEKTPPSAFFWSGERVQKLLSELSNSILHNQGFLIIIGKSGVGKSTLTHSLINALKDQVKCYLMSDPSSDPIDFYNTISKGYGLERTFTSKVEFLLYFGQFLHTTESEGRKTLLVIDNCHRISQDILEELKSLTSICTNDGNRLISILLTGLQPFQDMIMQPKNLIIQQQTMSRLELAPLDEQETQQYILHRLKSANAQTSIFTAKACAKISKITGGRPSKINTLCEQCLIVGASLNKTTIDEAIVRKAATGPNNPPRTVQTVKQVEDLAPKIESNSTTDHKANRALNPLIVENIQKLADLLLAFAKYSWGKVFLGLLLATLAYTFFNAAWTSGPQERLESTLETKQKSIPDEITVTLSPLKIVNGQQQRPGSFWQTHQNAPRLTKVHHKDINMFISQLNNISGLTLILKDMSDDQSPVHASQDITTKRLDELEKTLRDGGLQSAYIFRLSPKQEGGPAAIADAVDTPGNQVIELIVTGDDLWWSTLKGDQ